MSAASPASKPARNPEVILGQIPVLVPVEAEGDAMVWLIERFEDPQGKVVQADVRAAGEVEIGRKPPARAKDHFPEKGSSLEREVPGQFLFVEKLQKMREQDIDFDAANVAHSRKGGTLPELGGRQHQAKVFRWRGTSASRSDSRA